MRDENIVAVVAIGSTIRPAVESTDLDLLIICRDPEALILKPPLEVDLRTFASAKVGKHLAEGNDLLGWAIKFGRVLFQRSGFWDEMVASWQHRVPLPSVTVAERRVAEAFRRLIAVLEVGDEDAAREQALSYATNLARLALLRKNVYPASRPELPSQLRKVGFARIANWLDSLVDPAGDHSGVIEDITKSGFPVQNAF